MKGQHHPGSTAAHVLLMLLLFVSAAGVAAFAQDSIPLVYNVENTGASFEAPAFPDFAHLPIIRPLPDPFVFFADGRRDTSFASWEQRRNEIKAAMEKYELGPKPDCHDCTITATYTPATAPTRGTLVINVTRNVNGADVTATITTRCYIPSVAAPDGGFPAIIPMTGSAGSSNLGTGSLGASVFTGLPIASCDFPHNSTTTYGGARRTDNFYKLYPEFCAGMAAASNCNAANGFPDGSNSGQYAAWSWGVSRVIDGMKIATQQATNPLPINMSKLMVTGCSYAGKMALYAGAFDERIALTVAQENGGGGAPAWRTSTQIEAENVVENLDHTDTNWFGSQMWKFWGNDVYKLPHDHHELMAMVAPRALLQTGNTDYFWLSNRANTISSRATQKIYETLGIGDRFGFFIDGAHGHCSVPAIQVPVINSWVRKYLFDDATANTETKVTPFNNIDAARWTDWWGTNNPVFQNDWVPGDATVVLSTPGPQLPINTGDTLYAGYEVSMPGNHQAATITVPVGSQPTSTYFGPYGQWQGASVQADVSCPDGTSRTLTVMMPEQSYVVDAGDNAWHPGPGQNYQNSLINNAATACDGGIVKNVVFTALGKQATRGSGNAAGPGFISTNVVDPLLVRYHYSVGAPDAGAAWSEPETVTPVKAQITITAVLTKNTNGTYRAALTVKNNGTATVRAIRVTAATLGGVSATGNLPSPGDLLPGSIKATTLTFPATAGTSGTPSVLRIMGTYTGGSFSNSLRVVIP
ncbi:MAG TPA: hypothetical protein VN577_20505 [Terriglobales bacterium]|nr:hypothetical protein [Terriglobales bacterium]